MVLIDWTKSVKGYWHIREPICSFWYNNLEPGTVFRSTGFRDRQTGNREDLAGKKKTKSGIFPKTFLEYLVLNIPGNACSIVTIREDKPGFGFIRRKIYF